MSTFTTATVSNAGRRDASGRRAGTPQPPARGSQACPAAPHPTAILIDPGTHRCLLQRATAIHHAGLKSFGLLTADPNHPSFPYVAHDVVFFDPVRNRRNDPRNRAAFHAQGAYFRRYDDAGFVADPAELLAVSRAVEASGLEIVAAFHSHRRQPANFSLIDYRLHNPAFPWHLIVSFADPRRTVLQPFAVSKAADEFGIGADDGLDGSHLAYQGSGVVPVPLRLAHPRFARPSAVPLAG